MHMIMPKNMLWILIGKFPLLWRLTIHFHLSMSFIHRRFSSSDLTGTQFCGSSGPSGTSKKYSLVSIALFVRQTEVTSHLFHLFLPTCYHSYQSVLKPHTLTLLFAAGPGAGQPERPALLGDPLQTADTTASRCAKDDLCLSSMALCSLGVPLTPQSTACQASCYSWVWKWIFFPLWTTSQKKFLWPELGFKFSCQWLLGSKFSSQN